MPFAVSAQPRRAVVVAGNRTPFVRAFSDYLQLDAIALGVEAVEGLLSRTGLDRRTIDAVIWGGVILPPTAPNVGREICIDIGLPPSVEALTLSRACATGLQAITDAAARIERGEADVVIAGGGDSTSNATVGLPAEFVHAVAPVAMGRARGPGAWMRMMGGLWPPHRMLPRMPRVAERSTGEVMGEAADKMARINQISREAQDAFAVRSHTRAAAATDAGAFANELSPVRVGDREIRSDTTIRRDSTVERLARLRPAFGAEGTVTAGNACPLTDGASCTLLMSEKKARELGLTPLASFRSWAYVGVDPRDQLLMGPALAMPLALERARLALPEVDLVDIHEAFAAQVLSVLAMLESPEFARTRLERANPVGAVDPERLNITGGSISLGHPFAATGSRMVNSMATQLAGGRGQTALLGICAAGGLGAAAVLERID